MEEMTNVQRRGVTLLQLDQANTIDAVIHELEIIINSCIRSNSRLGYFASLYHKVTVKVREGILHHEFENGSQMEKFDVLFANRYLNALKQWRAKETPSAPWAITFQATNRISPLLLQHLLLAMNAHINLDLGIAAVELARSTGRDIQTLRSDFMSINNILGALTMEVTKEINKVSPLLSLFGLHAANNSLVIQFSLANARDGSWNFAEELYAKQGDDYKLCVQKRIETIEKLGSAIINTKGLIRITMFIVYLFEWKIPRKIINVLYHARRKYIQFNDTTSTGEHHP